MSINLNKDEIYTIPKLNQMAVGLGWDTRADLDAHARLYKNGKRGLFGGIKEKEIGHVYFCNKHISGVTLSGDNLTGEGDGDDEIITIDFDKLPKDVDRISISVNIFSGADNFSQVKGAFVRIVDLRSNTELSRYNLTNMNSKSKTITFGEIVRDGNGWKFIAK